MESTREAIERVKKEQHRAVLRGEHDTAQKLEHEHDALACRLREETEAEERGSESDACAHGTTTGLIVCKDPQLYADFVREFTRVQSKRGKYGMKTCTQAEYESTSGDKLLARRFEDDVEAANETSEIIDPHHIHFVLYTLDVPEQPMNGFSLTLAPFPGQSMRDFAESLV